jgi:hypothetical protein
VPGGLRTATLFTVTGAKKDDRIRLAVMDSYDGVVYRVGTQPGTSGYFQRVGQSVPIDVDGTTQRHVSITVERYHDVWVPDVGYLSSIRFGGPRAEELQQGFSYNASTGVGASAVRLQSGDRIDADAVLPVTANEAIGGSAARIPALDVDGSTPKEVKDLADSLAKKVASAPDAALKDAKKKGAKSSGAAVRLVEAIRTQLKAEGFVYSDGTQAGDGSPPSRPGHHAARLEDLTKSRVGNGEQYAPLLALISNHLGVPARVVMGFKVPDPKNGGAAEIKIKGEDVTAWVEVDVQGAGWVALDPVDVPKNQPPPKPNPTPQPQAAVPPPPPPPVPPVDDGITDTNKVSCKGKACTKDAGTEGGFAIPGVVLAAGGIMLAPIAVLGAITAVIAGLKSRRRTRRRSTGELSTRVAGGWNEVMDLAADLGSPIPALATRSEGARIVGSSAAGSLARYADAGIFGPSPLTDGWVGQYWQGVDDTREAMTAELSRFERWRVLVSLASLRASYTRRRADRRIRHRKADT